MRIPSNKIKDIVQFFKNELKEFYDEREIRSFINIVFQEFTSLNAAQLQISGDKTVSESTMLKIKFAINDLKTYKPIQYILGKTMFYDIEINVNPYVLIPRPETEELVHWIISDYSKTTGYKEITDIGCGSGCISLALKKYIMNSKIIAIDISDEAIKVAEKNALNNSLSIDFFQMDIFDKKNWSELPKSDIIVSNPPYVCQKEKEVMQANVLNFEPHLALFVDNDTPLIFYNTIADFAIINLKTDGSLYFEINENFAVETTELLKSKGFSECEIRKDMQHKARMLKAIR